MESVWSPETPATVRTQKYCDEIRKDIEEKLKRKLVDFIAIKYIVKEHQIGCTPYIVKIHDIGEVYVHAKFGVPVIPDGKNHPQFDKVQDNKKLDDHIVPF